MNLYHMKNIIKIDITTYILLILSMFTASFKKIIILFLIIIFHELGHIIWLNKYHKKIISINIYPFGGITKYVSFLNHNLIEELIISIGGIINQLIFYLMSYILFRINLLNSNTYTLFIKYNTLLIIFNLIPIIPLDGSKIINILLEYFFSYNKSLLLTIIISIISLVIFNIISLSIKINTLIIIVFMYFNIISIIKNYKYLKERYVLERYLYQFPYKKIKYDTSFNKNKFRQETYHYFNYESENKILTKIYKR